MHSKTKVHYLFLPGLHGTGTLFEPLTDCAPPNVECTVVTYPVDRELSYREYADYVIANFIPEKPFVIVAESFSGPVAVLAAERKPASLIGMVLCNTFVYSPAWSGFASPPWRFLFSFSPPQCIIGFQLTGFVEKIL